MTIAYYKTLAVNQNSYYFNKVMYMIFNAFSTGYQIGYNDKFTEERNIMSNLVDDFFEENTSIQLKDEYTYTIMEIMGNINLLSSKEDFLMNLLPKYYNVIDEKGVYDYLEKNKFLNSFLIEVACEINKIFGENIEINLVKEIDSEIPDLTKLVAYIDTSSWEMEKAIKYLNRFEDEWYIDNMDREKGKFDVDVL